MQQCMPYLISAVSIELARGTQAGKVVLCAMEDKLPPCCSCSMWPMISLMSACNDVSASDDNRSEGRVCTKMRRQLR